MGAYRDIRNNYTEIKDLAEQLKEEVEGMKNKINDVFSDCLNNMLSKWRENLRNRYKEIATDSETKLILGTDEGVVVVDFDYGDILNANIGIDLIFPNFFQSGSHAGSKLVGVTDSQRGNEVVYYNSVQEKYIVFNLDGERITEMKKEEWEKSPISNESWAFR